MAFCYYLSLTMACLGIAIFNISIHSTGKDYTCYSISQYSEKQYQDYLNHGIQVPANVNSPAVSKVVIDGVTMYLVPIPGSNLYSMFSLIIAIGYLIIMGFALILSLVLLWLSDLVPDDFLNMGWVKRAAAVFTKILPPIIVVFHWLVMILIIVFWGMLISKSCEASEPATVQFGFNNLKYHEDCITLQIVNSIVFFVLHYIFAILKDMIYVEPFMYSPQVGEKKPFREWTLQILGP